MRKVEISFLALILQCLFPALCPAFSSDCEIVRAEMYKKQQEVIATDWYGGIPYMRQKTETYPCANITFRNTGWQGMYSTDIEVSATFTDQGVKDKKIACEKKRLEPGDEYSCSICFESDFPISNLECRFR